MTFDLTFWHEEYTDPDSFVQGGKRERVTAEITYSLKSNNQNYKVALKDIGLRTKFEDFEISKEGNNWKIESANNIELTLLKMEIVSALEVLQIPGRI